MVKKNILTLILLLGLAVRGLAVEPPKVQRKMERHRRATKEDKSFNVGMFKRQSGMIALNFSKQEEDVVKIKIYNARGEVIHKRRIKQHDLVSYNYDLSRLRPGKYYFEVSNKASRYYFEGFAID